jgi:hypothetical protein
MTRLIETEIAPAEEVCVRTGTPNYDQLATRQGHAFIRQLQRQAGPAPSGVSFQLERIRHGSEHFYQVVCIAEECDQAAVSYRERLENSLPDRWDSVAREELADVLAHAH